MNKITWGDRAADAIITGLMILTFAFLDALLIDLAWGATVGKCMSCTVFKVALFICLCAYSMAWSIKRIVKD